MPSKSNDTPRVPDVKDTSVKNELPEDSSPSHRPLPNYTYRKWQPKPFTKEDFDAHDFESGILLDPLEEEVKNAPDNSGDG